MAARVYSEVGQHKILTGTNRVFVATDAANQTVFVDMVGYFPRQQVNQGFNFECPAGSSCIVSSTSSDYTTASDPAKSAEVTWRNLGTVAANGTLQIEVFPATFRFVFSTPAGSMLIFSSN